MPTSPVQPSYYGPPTGGPGSLFGFNGSSTHVTCTIDGVPADCNKAIQSLNNGTLTLDLGTSRGIDGIGVPVPEIEKRKRRNPAKDGKRETVWEVTGWRLYLFAPTDPQNTPPKELPVDKIRSGVEGLLRNPKCAGFIDKLLAQVFKSTGDMAAGTPMEVFDEVQKQGGFVFGPLRYKNTPVNYAVGYVGVLGLGHAQIQINNEQFIANEALYFVSVLHELIHASGSFRNYDDRVLAEAVDRLGLGQTGANLPDQRDIIGNSQFWTYALDHACVPGASKDTKWQQRLDALLR